MDDFGTSDYGYVEQPRKGIPGLFDQYVKTSIPAQLIGGGVKGLLNMLPVNRTGIMQNELLGAGFALDNIGRIVSITEIDRNKTTHKINISNLSKGIYFISVDNNKIIKKIVKQ